MRQHFNCQGMTLTQLPNSTGGEKDTWELEIITTAVPIVQVSIPCLPLLPTGFKKIFFFATKLQTGRQTCWKRWESNFMLVACNSNSSLRHCKTWQSRADLHMIMLSSSSIMSCHGLHSNIFFFKISGMLIEKTLVRCLFTLNHFSCMFFTNSPLCLEWRMLFNF